MPELDRFLSSLDAAFLYFETEREPLHIGSCMVYEGRIEKEELVALLEDRLHRVPRYRQRVVFAPWNVSHPLWVDDPDFAAENHVDVVEMEGPVTPEVLGRYAAEAYQGMLDRDRPLWHLTILHGLPGHDSAAGDNTAVVWKVHHAMIDGVSGVDLTMALNDLTARPETPSSRPAWTPATLPEGMTLLQEAVQHRMSEVTSTVTDSWFEAFQPDKALERWRRVGPGLASGFERGLRPMTPMPWNRPVSGDIGYAWTELSFTEVRQVKSALGGTVNDLVLAILSGGLGRYLKHRGVDPTGVELRAMCPVSMRSADEQGALGNLVSTLIAPLFVGIDDPVERLAAERGAMEELKKAGQAEAFYELSRLAVRVPPAWQAMAGRMTSPQQTAFNTVSTNVPGPQIPLYQSGRKLLSWFPMGVVSNNLGLFVAILTYNQKITIGTTVDRALVPDVWELSRCLHEAYEELRHAAGVEIESLDSVPFDEISRSEVENPVKAKPGTKSSRSTKSGARDPKAVS